MTENKFDFLEDSDGNKSSKRLWGSLTMGSGLFMAVILFFCTVCYPSVEFNTSVELMEYMLGIGSILLGLGLAEKFFKK